MLFKHTLMYFLARGLPGLISFLSIMIYTRMLTPDQYGKYALVLAGVNLCNALFFQWLRQGLLRFSTAHEEADRRVFRSTLATGFVGLTCLTAIIAIFVFLLSLQYQYFMYVLVGLVNLWLLAWFEFVQTDYRAQLKPKAFGLVTFSRTLLCLVFSLLFIWLGWGEIGLLAGLLVGTLIILVGPTVREWGSIRPKELDKAVMKQLLSYGLPLTLTFVMAFVMQLSDRFLLGWLSGTEATGVYAVASDFANQSLFTIMMIVNLSAFPLVVKKLEAEGVDEAQKQLRMNLVLLLGISLPATMGVILLAEPISKMFFGSQFAGTVSVLLPLLIVGNFLMGLKQFYFDQAFQLGNKTMIQIFPVIVGAILNVVLNLIFIPLWGVTGSAYASIAATAAAVVLSWFFGRKCFHLPIPYGDILKIILCSLFMIAALLPFLQYQGPLVICIEITVAILVYLLGVWALNVAGVRGRLLDYLKVRKTKGLQM
ncbi:oligosaccharide flippase family protein [Paenibacillus chartarius]|uniref:Oligosaccharide flippase family protein n=1 Tax=Paenibacillus chartarius TaxID=747481 RepID=A0ABV6DLI7_9BACL